ncbi:unnamed protein product [Bursaphelenchus okinawaensis]|uniref:ABC-2 type transporter transmembrane domain-containing protein n=1 Tax=Bursaphelenchus okinawaensis TaxID=465554 RepID=A0A811L5G1_9BILA|nr:unnamed protein product [Bursaphelenchus okinawaensis]CAG9117004.1 unnamed protein product [Bursaphelenchus okinawaensis]
MGALYFVVAELTYSTMFGILAFMPNDFPLVSREYHDGLYYPISYYLSKVCSFLPLFTLDGLIMMTISFVMILFNGSVKTLMQILGSGVLIEWSAAACGVMLSTIFPSYAIAMSVAGPLITVLSLVGGIYANVGHLPVYIRWMQYISWFKYGFEAFSIFEWLEVEEDGCVVQLRNVSHLALEGSDQRNVTCLSADDILDLYSLKRENIYLDIGVLLGFIVFFYTIGLFSLYIRLRLSR